VFMRPTAYIYPPSQLLASPGKVPALLCSQHPGALPLDPAQGFDPTLAAGLSPQTRPPCIPLALVVAGCDPVKAQRLHCQPRGKPSLAGAVTIGDRLSLRLQHRTSGQGYRPQNEAVILNRRIHVIAYAPGEQPMHPNRNADCPRIPPSPHR
jgi:hypothetical protein